MGEPVVKISPQRLKGLLQKSYELGCQGYAEIAGETAEQLFEELVSQLPVVEKTPRKQQPLRGHPPNNAPVWDLPHEFDDDLDDAFLKAAREALENPAAHNASPF